MELQSGVATRRENFSIRIPRISLSVKISERPAARCRRRRRDTDSILPASRWLWISGISVERRPGSVFTTIANWRQPERQMTFDGEVYHWSKHHEFLKFLYLPNAPAQRVRTRPEQLRGAGSRDASGSRLAGPASAGFLGRSRGLSRFYPRAPAANGRWRKTKTFASAAAGSAIAPRPILRPVGR